jgi:hypothetical protein
MVANNATIVKQLRGRVWEKCFYMAAYRERVQRDAPQAASSEERKMCIRRPDC